MLKWEEEFEDTKGVIRIRKSKKRQRNGQKKKYETHQQKNNKSATSSKYAKDCYINNQFILVDSS